MMTTMLDELLRPLSPEEQSLLEKLGPEGKVCRYCKWADAGFVPYGPWCWFCTYGGRYVHRDFRDMCDIDKFEVRDGKPRDTSGVSGVETGKGE